MSMAKVLTEKKVLCLLDFGLFPCSLGFLVCAYLARSSRRSVVVRPPPGGFGLRKASQKSWWVSNSGCLKGWNAVLHVVVSCLFIGMFTINCGILLSFKNNNKVCSNDATQRWQKYEFEKCDILTNVPKKWYHRNFPFPSSHCKFQLACAIPPPQKKGASEHHQPDPQGGHLVALCT